MISSAGLSADASLFPDAVDVASARVSLVKVSRADLAGEAFLDERWDRTGLARDIRPLSALAPRGHMTGSGLLFIWHTAFCCSTLLARCLDKPGQNLALREPAALMGVASLYRTGRASEARSALAGIIGQMAAGLGQDPRVTIKPTNTVNNLLPECAELFAQSRHVLLSSSLKSFLISIAKKGEAGRAFARQMFTVFALDGHAIARTDQRQLMQMSDLQIAALVWHMQMETFRAALKRFGPECFVWLDGDAFVSRPAQALNALDEWAGLGLGASHARDIADGPLLTRNAKSPDEAFGAKTRLSQAGQIAAQLGPELDQIVNWSCGLFPGSNADGHLPVALTY